MTPYPPVVKSGIRTQGNEVLFTPTTTALSPLAVEMRPYMLNYPDVGYLRMIEMAPLSLGRSRFLDQIAMLVSFR